MRGKDSLMTEGASAPKKGVGAGAASVGAPVWRSSKADERRVGAYAGEADPHRVLPPQTASLYDDDTPSDDVMGGRAAVQCAKYVTFRKALFQPEDLRTIECAAVAPPPSRYTPKPRPSKGTPVYSMPREVRKTGLTRPEEQKLRDMEGVAPGTYFPHDRATRPEARSAFFEGRYELKPPSM